MNWRPHTVRPLRAPQSVLIAMRDDEEGAPLLMSGIYYWDGERFRHEDTGKSPRVEVFWWLPEDEVLEGVPA